MVSVLLFTLCPYSIFTNKKMTDFRVLSLADGKLDLSLKTKHVSGFNGFINHFSKDDKDGIKHSII